VIDFSNGSFFKLSEIHPQEIGPAVAPLLIQGEQLVACSKSMRDFTSLPYNEVQAFSIETARTFDLDAELDLWFSGLGKVRLEFKGNADVRALGQMIATYVL